MSNSENMGARFTKAERDHLLALPLAKWPTLRPEAAGPLARAEGLIEPPVYTQTLDRFRITGRGRAWLAEDAAMRRLSRAEIDALPCGEQDAYFDSLRQQADAQGITPCRLRAARESSDPTGVDALTDLCEDAHAAAQHALSCKCAACLDGDPFASVEWQGWE